MPTKLAADLQPGDIVQVVPGDVRTVAETALIDTPVSPDRETSVRIRWVNRPTWAVVDPDKEFTLAEDGDA